MLCVGQETAPTMEKPSSEWLFFRFGLSSLAAAAVDSAAAASGRLQQSASTLIERPGAEGAAQMGGHHFLTKGPCLMRLVRQ